MTNLVIVSFPVFFDSGISGLRVVWILNLSWMKYINESIEWNQLLCGCFRSTLTNLFWAGWTFKDSLTCNVRIRIWWTVTLELPLYLNYSYACLLQSKRMNNFTAHSWQNPESLIFSVSNRMLSSSAWNFVVVRGIRVTIATKQEYVIYIYVISNTVMSKNWYCHVQALPDWTLMCHDQCYWLYTSRDR